MAASSASRPRRRPSGSVASRMRSAWPPPPSVASTCWLPAAGASIATTSSARTGTWLTGIGSRGVGWSVISSDPEPADRVREPRRVIHLAAVDGPTIGRPDLAVVAHADDEGLGGDAHLGTQVGRHQDAALAVHLGLQRAGEDRPLEEPARGISQGNVRDLGL